MAAKAVLTGTHFMNGDYACCEGALAVGCRFFGGYPITPATEVAERMSSRLPDIGGIYIQMEDELGSIAAVLGASWGGMKAMTSTSGPGVSLMMDNIGLGLCTETPCVVCNVQRAGPSTGLPTLVGQGDMMQARWGSHGIYEIIAVSPSSPQEMFDFTIWAFNLSEQYRVPVMIMADEVVGHMTERVVIPAESEIEIVSRRKPKSSPDRYLPFRPGADGVAPMANFGDGYVEEDASSEGPAVYRGVEAVGRLLSEVRPSVALLSKMSNVADPVALSEAVTRATNVRCLPVDVGLTVNLETSEVSTAAGLVPVAALTVYKGEDGRLHYNPTG